MKRGRPPNEQRRVPMGLRVTPEMRDELVARAKAKGRSITQEMELLLEQALLIDKLLERKWGEGFDMTPRAQEIVTAIRRYAETIRKAASAPTTGGARTNTLLRDIAERLERRATEIEQGEQE